MVECVHYKHSDENVMESILYGVMLAGVIGFIFFMYRYVRHSGWKCVSDGEKICVADNINQFYSAEDQQKENTEI